MAGTQDVIRLELEWDAGPTWQGPEVEAPTRREARSLERLYWAAREVT